MSDYKLKEDVMSLCDVCMVAREKTEGPTIVYIVPTSLKTIILSLCEKHLVEASELLLKLKSENED